MDEEKHSRRKILRREPKPDYLRHYYHYQHPVDKSAWRVSRGNLLSRLFLSFLLLASPVENVEALPAGGTIKEGEAQIEYVGDDRLNVYQLSDKLVLDWDTFNIDSNDAVRFFQPNATSVTLNRMFDQSATQIFGTLEANGRIYLINPQGFVFGPGSQINVNSLFVTTLDINNADFMKGYEKFTEAVGGSTGSIIASGTIRAAAGGFVGMVADSVENKGNIIANYGQVQLSAGKAATLDFSGDNLIRIQVDGEVVNNARNAKAAVINTGVIQADSGKVILSAKAASDVFTQAVNNEGIVKATRIEEKGGEIYLMGFGGDVENNGTLTASSETKSVSAGKIEITGKNIKTTGTITAESIDADGGVVTIEAEEIAQVAETGSISTKSEEATGGAIHLFGDKVGMFDQFVLEASGATGGGEILVGGDYRGSGPYRLANFNYMAPETKIISNALEVGDGGKVIVWSELATRAYGTIEAKGGEVSGDGGLAEVSGKQYLEMQASVDLTSPFGKVGTLLLDPYNITIQDAGTTTNPPGASANPWESASNSSILTTANLETMLASASVTVQTGAAGAQDGDITVSNNIDWSSAYSLTLSAVGGAASDITVNAAITATGAGGGNLVANNNITLGAGGALTMNSGDIVITANTLAIGANISSAGKLTIKPKTSNTMGISGGAGTLNLDATEINYLQNGFSSITFGDATNTSTMTINADTWADDVNFLTANAGITFAGAFSGTTGEDVDLTANAGTNTITTSATIGASGFVDEITFTANSMALGAAMTSTSTVILKPSSSSRAINLGTGTGGLDLTDTELDYITVTTLRIGANDSSTGAITVTSDINAANVSTLHLRTPSTITGTVAGIVETNLALTAGGTINFTYATTDVDVLSISDSGQTVTFTDTDAIDLGSVDSVTGVTATTFNLTSGSITDSQASTISGVTTIVAGTKDITLNHASNNFGTVAITSGNNVTLVDTNALTLNASTISSAFNVTSGGTLTVGGAISATGGATTFTADSMAIGAAITATGRTG